MNGDLFDSETGQPFFQPKVGRGPKFQQRVSPGRGNVGAALYEQSLLAREKQEMKKKALAEEKRIKENTVFTKDNTNRIIERIKLQRFSDIFKQLDSDNDG